jgi:hypothetical protein
MQFLGLCIAIVFLDILSAGAFLQYFTLCHLRSLTIHWLDYQFRFCDLGSSSFAL